jgi:hypothetical protein
VIIPFAASSDDAVIFSAEAIDLCTVKAELLWVSQHMYQEALEFDGIGCLQLPKQALGNSTSAVLTDVILTFAL